MAGQLQGHDDEDISTAVNAYVALTVGTAGEGAATTTQSPKKEKKEKKKDEATDAFWKHIEGWLQEYGLSQFSMVAAKHWVERTAEPENEQKMERLRKLIMAKGSGKLRCQPSDPSQLGCPEIIPGLRAHSFWDTDLPEMAWTKKVEEAYPIIKEELMALRSQKGFQPYRQPDISSKTKTADDKIGAESHDTGEWNVFYLFLHNIKFDENAAKCPKTAAIIESVVPRQYKHCFFSALGPGTHVSHHNGPTNKKLRVQLPLTGVQNSRLRSGTETRELEEGKCLVFDDSFDHEAWHDGPDTRIILIFDIWHPDLTNEEVKFLDFLSKNQLRQSEKVAKAGDSSDTSNFYNILEKTKDLLEDNSWWK